MQDAAQRVAVAGGAHLDGRVVEDRERFGELTLLQLHRAEVEHAACCPVVRAHEPGGGDCVAQVAGGLVVAVAQAQQDTDGRVRDGFHLGGQLRCDRAHLGGQVKRPLAGQQRLIVLGEHQPCLRLARRELCQQQGLASTQARRGVDGERQRVADLAALEQAAGQP